MCRAGKNVGTLAAHIPIPLTQSKPTGLAPPVAPLASLRRRNSSMFPPIFGAVAYVLFHSGARLAAHEPVTTAADIAISFFARPGISHTIGVPKGSKGGHGRTFEDATCEAADGTFYQQRTPPEQCACSHRQNPPSRAPRHEPELVTCVSCDLRLSRAWQTARPNGSSGRWLQVTEASILARVIREPLTTRRRLAGEARARC